MEASVVLLFFRALAASSRDSFGDFVWFSFWQDDVIISTREWSQIRGNPQDRIGGTAGFYV
jgi:hypothetical protein